MHGIVVFGGGGLVGSEVIEEISKSSPLNLFSPKSKEVNLNNQNYVDDFAKSLANSAFQSFSLVFIASVNPYRASKHDDFDEMLSNVKMSYNVIAALTDINITEVIFTSTLDVYKKNIDVITEQSPTEPASNYAIFKLAAEFLFKSFAQKKKVPFCCLRLTNLYGINDNSPKVINKFFESAFNSGTITIHGKNSERDFMHVKDAAKVVTHFIGKKVNDTINVATGKSVSLNFLAKTIASCFDKEIKLNYVENTVVGSNSIKFDITKLRHYYNGDIENIETVIPILYESKKI